MRIVHFRFQATVMAFGMSIALFCLAIVYAADQVFFRRSQDALVQAGLPPDHAIFYFLDQQRLLMKGAFALALAGGCLASLAIGWILSDRVATPLKQMQEHFLRVARGAMPTRFHFRKTDFFQEVADAYNLQLEKLDLLPKTKPEKKGLKIK